MSISAQQSAAANNGSPVGPVGFVKMATDSKITVGNGGKLYAWGYITGSGEVEALSGATVYEDFQRADWRGGNCTTQIVDNVGTYHNFPMSQYYVQNIEVPLKLHAGAIEKAYMSITVTLLGVQGAELPFIGTSDSMFSLTSGYIVKDYIEGEGRLKIEAHGDICFFFCMTKGFYVSVFTAKQYITYCTVNIFIIAACVHTIRGFFIFFNRSAFCMAISTKLIFYSGYFSITYCTVNYHIIAAFFCTSRINKVFLYRTALCMCFFLNDFCVCFTTELACCRLLAFFRTS